MLLTRYILNSLLSPLYVCVCVCVPLCRSVSRSLLVVCLLVVVICKNKNVDDIKLGSINLVNEGYWDSITVFEWMKNKARENGVEYVENEVIEIIKNESEDQSK